MITPVKKSLLLWLAPTATAQAIVSYIPQIAPAQCTSLAEGSPLEARTASCGLLNPVLDILELLGEPAIVFCISYLNVPSVTPAPM